MCVCVCAGDGQKCDESTDEIEEGLIAIVANTQIYLRTTATAVNTHITHIREHIAIIQIIIILLLFVYRLHATTKTL